MVAQHKFRNSKSLARVATVALALAALCYALNGADLGCGLLERTSWVAADILRLVILRADWHMLLPSLCRVTRLVQLFLQLAFCS